MIKAKPDLTNIPFIFLVRLDTIDRLENIVAVAKFLVGKMESKILVIECAPFKSGVIEITFHKCLTKFKVNYFIVSVSVLLGMLTISFIRDYSWIPKSYLMFSVIKIIYILLFAVLIGGFLWLFRKKIACFETIWNKNAAFLVYFMSTLFAVVHINNLRFEHSDLIFMPLILSPFFVYGLSFGYLRIRLGIRYSIALHIIINGVAIGLPELISALKASTPI